MSNGPESTNITNRSGGANLDAARDINIGGDVVGRDKIVMQAAPAVGIVNLHQLPPSPPDFTGREQELARLLSAVLDKGVTTIGLHGLGGVGKTVLALRLAEQLASIYKDAQFYIDLKGTTQPLSTAEVMVRVLRAYYPTALLPENEAELRGLYQSILKGSRVLLLLDNAANADQVVDLIPPVDCALIITSRQHFALPGMLSKSLDKLPANAARALLLAIVPRIASQANNIARLCGYLPLALRLAASSLAVHVNLSPADYARRLRSTRKRLELVDASLSLSYDLLPENLQRLWCKLAIFNDVFDEKAAIVALELKPSAAQDALSELVKTSLIEWDEINRRYHWHDLVRLFAAERLGRSERQAIHRRLADYYQYDKQQRYPLEAIYHLQQAGEYRTAVRLVTGDISALIGLGRTSTLQSLLEQFKAKRLDAEQSIVVNLSLGEVYTLRGESKKARRKFNLALKQGADLTDSPTRAVLLARACRGQGELLEHESPQAAADWLLRGLRELAGAEARLEADICIKLSSIQLELGNYRAAQSSVERSLQLLPRRPGQLRAAALLNQSGVYYKLGDSARGERVIRQALKISEQIHDDWTLLKAKLSLATEIEIAGDWKEAEPIYQEAVELAERLLAIRPLVSLCINLGLLKTNQGEYTDAAAYLQKGLELARTHNLKVHLINGLCNLANLFLRQNDGPSALSALPEAESLAKDIGYDPILPEIYRSFAHAHLLQEDWSAAANFAQRSVSLAEEFEDEVELGKSLRVRGQIQWAANRHELALKSFQQSAALLAEREPYEAARTQAEWGRCLIACGETERGTALVQVARVTFQRLGTQQDLAAAEKILGDHH